MKCLVSIIIKKWAKSFQILRANLGGSVWGKLVKSQLFKEEIKTFLNTSLSVFLTITFFQIIHVPNPTWSCSLPLSPPDTILLYCTVLYCTVLYCTVLYCTVLYCTVLYCTVLYCTVLYCTVLYCTVLYCTVLYCTVLYCTVLYCTVLYCTVLYCTVLCCTILYCTVLYCTVLYCTQRAPKSPSGGARSRRP